MSSVIVTPVRRSDAAELVRANCASRDYHAPWSQPFTDMNGFDAWFGRTVTGPNLGFVARERSSGAVAGVVNLSEVVWGNFCSAYLGYYGVASSARRGLMTEAVREIARHAFEEVGLHRLEANIQPGKLASVALVRRLGFHNEGFSPRYLRIGGVWRDHERWALLASAPPD